MLTDNEYYKYLVHKKHIYGARLIYAKKDNRLKEAIFYQSLYNIYKSNAKTFRVAIRLKRQPN